MKLGADFVKCHVLKLFRFLQNVKRPISSVIMHM